MTHPWPFFGLRITTPRLELRPPTDDDLAALAEVVDRGVHPPDFMPFSIPWTEWGAVSFMQYHWRCRGTLTPTAWDLPLATVIDGEVVGVQGVSATEFLVRREVSTGSWLGQAHQGKGIGKEMRAAILHFAFEGLGADTAVSAARIGNQSSLGVSSALGYEDDGIEIVGIKGEAVRQTRLRLDRAAWEQHRRDDVVIEGLGPCLPLLGLDRP